MTVFGRDASNFDGVIDYSGLGFFTHKATEGTGIVHDQYGPRLNAARVAGVPVLGAYHVLRTPGSGGAGSLAAQLGFWVAQMDARTPWWRAHPHFMLQIDAEHWPYDNVSAGTVMDFARLLAAAGLPGYKITYASRGQYGDSLHGIATPLWNANYSGGPAYPGDGWAPGWGPYSGQTPALLQYTDSPYDHNAYRGTLDSLLAVVGGVTKGTTDMQWNGAVPGSMDKTVYATPDPVIADLAALLNRHDSYYAPGNRPPLAVQLDSIEAAAKAAGGGAVSQDQVDAAVSKVMGDPAWIGQLAAALAGHLHVS